MGMIRKAIICIIICITILFTSCKSSVFAPDVSLYAIDIMDVQAHSSAAYYLSKDGKLYCTGVDTDSASFVTYKERRTGLVAENVKSFVELVGGGCYIDYNDNLYMWNQDVLPLYGYHTKTEHTYILDNVKFVASYLNCIIYIDKASNLYLIGTFLESDYSMDEPKLLAKNVLCADIFDQTILWAEENGSIRCFGELDSSTLSVLNAHFKNTNISDINLTKNFITLLCDDKLWFYGDHKKLVSGNESSKYELLQLGSNISKVSCAYRTIIALDFEGNAMLWGRCISNDVNDTKSAYFQFLDGFVIANNAANVFVSDSCICYIDKWANSHIYYSSGWPSLYGNSTSELYVGINGIPNTWSN